LDPIVPIVVAAGASSRMGSPKAALRLGDRTALRWILDACAEAGLGPAIVVSGAHPDAVREAARGAAPFPSLVQNEAWASGRTSSIRAGLGALPDAARAFLLWPVDVPLAGPALPLLLEAFRSRRPGELACVPSHGDRRGHPIVFDRSVGRELEGLAPDASARDVVRGLAARGALRHVVVADPGVLWDMDSPEDHDRLAREVARRERGGA
jgi:molybdenum cofactor cytidylyltransferase